MVWTVAELILGVVIAAMTLRDVFDTVIVPGGSRTTLHTPRRLVRLLLPVWKRVRGRRRGLSTIFAPFILVTSFALWMILLAVAFGLLAHAVADSFHPRLSSFGDAVFTAGSSLVTVGQSEVVVTGSARWVMLAAGFCGLAVMTMAVTYLLEVQSSISRRDTIILKLLTSAGDPPSALALLEKHAAIGNQRELREILRGARDWCATVRQSHVSHPSLIYFRTAGTGSGWPAALGALLDLALIVERWLDSCDERGLAILLREEGCRLAEDLISLIGIAPDPAPLLSRDVEEMAGRLAAAGYREKPGFDSTAFAAERARHASLTRALADHLGRPPAQLLPALV